MTSWRIDLTVLTDLSASMFAACFVILLIFLSLAQHADGPAAPGRRTIEATQALRIVRQTVLKPGEMVELLRSHGRTNSGIGLDVFADRVDVTTAAGQVSIPATGLDVGLRRAVNDSGGPVRLYVFSSTLYNRVVAALDGSGQARLEITTPSALRDADRPTEAWSPAFLLLAAQSLSPQAFRKGLAVLLAAKRSEGGESSGGTGDASGSPAPAAEAVYIGLLDRMRLWLAHVAAIAFPAAGFIAVIWIERRRFRFDAGSPAA